MQPDDGSPPERLGQEFPNRERQKCERFFGHDTFLANRFWVGGGADEAVVTARSNGSKEGMRVETRCG
jgi:hypothetical protein